MRLNVEYIMFNPVHNIFYLAMRMKDSDLFPWLPEGTIIRALSFESNSDVKTSDWDICIGEL